MTVVQAAVLHELGLSAAAAAVLKPLLQAKGARPSGDYLLACLLQVDICLALQQLYRAAGVAHLPVLISMLHPRIPNAPMSFA